MYMISSRALSSVQWPDTSVKFLADPAEIGAQRKEGLIYRLNLRHAFPRTGSSFPKDPISLGGEAATS